MYRSGSRCTVIIPVHQDSVFSKKTHNFKILTSKSIFLKVYDRSRFFYTFPDVSRFVMFFMICLIAGWYPVFSIVFWILDFMENKNCQAPENNNWPKNLNSSINHGILVGLTIFMWHGGPFEHNVDLYKNKGKLCHKTRTFPFRMSAWAFLQEKQTRAAYQAGHPASQRGSGEGDEDDEQEKWEEQVEEKVELKKNLRT